MTTLDDQPTLVATLDVATAPPLDDPDPDEPDDEPDGDDAEPVSEPDATPALAEPVDIRPTFVDDELTPIFNDVCTDMRDDVPRVVAELHGTE